MPISREFVASSNVISIGYDEPSETLEVEFSGGAVYQYYNVPKVIFENFRVAPSKGQFLNAMIRNIYPYSRVG